MFPCRASFFLWHIFLCLWHVFETFIKVPSIHSPPPPCPEKYHHSFCKMLHLKRLIVFWIALCFDHCSVICIVTLCYINQQIQHSKFWPIQCSVLCFTRKMPAYVCYILQALLRYIHVIEKLLRHIHIYSGIFSTLCNHRIFTILSYSEPSHI